MSSPRRGCSSSAAGPGISSLFAFVLLPAVLVSTLDSCSSGTTPPPGNGSWLATAYGPPWGGIQGDGVTATGINLTAGPPDARGRGRPERDPAAQLRARAAEPVRHLGRLLRRRHRRRDHRPPRRHLRLARPRRPGRLGDRQVSVTPAADPGAGERARTGPGPSTGFRRQPSAGQPAGTRTRSRTRPRSCPGGSTWASTTRARPDRRARRRDRHLLAGGGHRLGAVLVLGRTRRRGRVQARRRRRPGPLRLRDRGDRPEVQVGQQIAAGQPVATFTGCIEMGWATGTGDQPMAAALGQACTTATRAATPPGAAYSMSQLIVAAGGPAGVLQPGGSGERMLTRAPDRAVAVVLALTLAAAASPTPTDTGAPRAPAETGSQRSRPRWTVAPPGVPRRGRRGESPGGARSLRGAVRQLDRRDARRTSGSSRRSRPARPAPRRWRKARTRRRPYRYAASNSGRWSRSPRARQERGRWAVVTDERTNGYGPTWAFPATSHVTWATVACVAGGWVVSGWYPGS